MVDKADNPINSGMHSGCVDDALVSMDLSEEERSKLLQVMAKAKVLIVQLSRQPEQECNLYIMNCSSVTAYCR